MEPLLNQLNERLTLQTVDEHLQSLSYLSHKITIDQSSEIEASNRLLVKESDPVRPSKIIRDMNKVDQYNRRTHEYLVWILECINELNPYDRRILVEKYIYLCDDEELENSLGFTMRKIREDLKDAKIRLAFIMGEEKFA